MYMYVCIDIYGPRYGYANNDCMSNSNSSNNKHDDNNSNNSNSNNNHSSIIVITIITSISIAMISPVHLLRVFLSRVLESNFPGDPSIKFYGHRNSHLLELRVCLSRAQRVPRDVQLLGICPFHSIPVAIPPRWWRWRWGS